MNVERWQDIERLYHLALEREPAERAALLQDADGADPSVVDEVRVLLEHASDAETFLGSSALEVAAASEAAAMPALVGTTIGSYEVLALIGMGGMGEVYRARDPRLQRDVALKVIVSASSPSHFEAEARAASRLNHPNIVTIYDVGEVGDVSYLAMEIVAGRTLRGMLADGPVPIDQALEIAAQLADALAAAHAVGVHHRDLKPENVMVTPAGLVKVLDFGIARRDDAPDVMSGSMHGTVGYMAPEQVAGAATDHRADQFAFGVVCFEMATGRIPGESDARGSGPSPMRPWLDRCLARDPAERYADTRDLAREVRTARDGWRRARTPSLMTRRRMLAMGGVAVAAAAGVAIWRLWAVPIGPRSLSILPFVNAAGDTDLDYVCDGLADGLTERLRRVPSLTVSARSAAANFRGAAIEPAVVAKTLGVEAILRGVITPDGERLRVTAELFDLKTGAILWRREVTVARATWFLAQPELALGLVDDGLAMNLSREERRRVGQGLTSDAMANDLYVRALYSHRLNTEDGYITARDLLEQAVARDPQFARAFVALASTFTVSAIDGYMRPVEAWPQSIKYVNRALRLDPDLPDAHAERAAAAFFFMWDWDASEHEWTEATNAGAGEINPDLFAGQALHRWALGDNVTALRLAERARQIDPISPMYAIRCADLLVALDRLSEAATTYEYVTTTVPGDIRPHFGLAEVRYRQGRVADAVASLRRGFAAAGQADVAATRAGATDEETYRAVMRAGAMRQLTALDARAHAGDYVSPFDRARTYARLGDTERAFALFEAAFDDHSPDLVFLNADSVWTTMRGDERFKAAVRRVGLRS